MDASTTPAFSTPAVRRLFRTNRLIMLLLFHKQGYGMPLREIVRRMGIVYPLASVACDQLVRDGLLDKNKAWRDRRRIIYYLTEKGIEEARQMWDAVHQLVAEASALQQREAQ
jgi:DNA-binding MarR family transcriptional regulator